MYNTIDMGDITINDLQIKFFKRGGFSSCAVENELHVKILPYLSVVQSVEGSYDIRIGGTEGQTGERGFFIAPSEETQTITHHVDAQSKRMTCRWLFLDAEINGVHRLDAVYRFPTVLGKDEKEEMNALFDRLFATEDICKTYACIYEIIGLLLRVSHRSEKKADFEMQNVVRYVKGHYAEVVRVKDLAKIARRSESDFYAAFKRQCGVSPIAYLNGYRLSIAADRLTETNDSVREIAAAVGIADPLYFCKFFKKHYGATPSEYRATRRAVLSKK